MYENKLPCYWLYQINSPNFKQKKVHPDNAQITIDIPTTEKNRSGPQMSKLPPSRPFGKLRASLIWPSAQTIFLSARPQSPCLRAPYTHYPDEAQKTPFALPIWYFSQTFGNYTL